MSPAQSAVFVHTWSFSVAVHDAWMADVHCPHHDVSDAMVQ